MVEEGKKEEKPKVEPKTEVITLDGFIEENIKGIAQAGFKVWCSRLKSKSVGSTKRNPKEWKKLYEKYKKQEVK